MPQKNDGKNSKAPVLNFLTAREEKIEEKRRNYERILFKNVLGVYTVVEQKGLHAIELIDISKQGMSFQLPLKADLKLKVGDSLNLRLYFASESYLPICVKIVRILDSIEEGSPIRQYGCEIDTSFKAYQAVHHFVEFITSCAEHGHEDKEHLKIFY